MSSELENKPAVRKSSLWRTTQAVSWSFMGIRKNSASQEDVAQINPFHVIVIGIVGVLFLVVSLIALVNWVVAK
jgi:hypothetical protein